MKLYNLKKYVYIYFWGSEAYYNIIKSPCKNVVFYNNYHNGDVHYSREFIKFFISNIHSKNYYYIHPNASRILLDVKRLTIKTPIEVVEKWRKLELNTYKKDKQTNILRYRDTLYINTWIGKINWKGRRKIQKLELFHNCTLEANYYSFLDIAKTLGIKKLNTMESYIPTIDFTFFKTTKIDQYMQLIKDSLKVFVCNAESLSNQSINFDMSPIINKLSLMYADVKFLVTNKSDTLNIDTPNIEYTSNIIKLNCNDLIENGYISTFCDIIIGRASGAYCFATIKENWNSNKPVICFSKNSKEGMWANNSTGIHSEVTDFETIFDIINTEINKCKGKLY